MGETGGGCMQVTAILNTCFEFCFVEIICQPSLEIRSRILS